MGTIRRFLIILLGAKGSAAISVGSHMRPDGTQAVALNVADRWKRTAVQLSPAGARRIAAQMTEWADASEKNNDKLAQSRTVMQWEQLVTSTLPLKATVTEA